MAENGQKRDPVSHRTPAQNSRRWKDRSAASKAKNKVWKEARRKAEKAGMVKKGDGRDVHHVKPLDKGGSNKMSNLKATSPSKNRALKGAANGMAKRAAKKRASK